MSDFRNDLKHYRWGLAALVLTLSIGGAAVAISQGFFNREQSANAAAQKQLKDALRELSAAQDDRANMANYAEEYAVLLKRNIIGSEQRLDWIDGLETIRKENVALGFSYTIAPQKTYTPPTAIDSGNFVLNASDMTLHLDLLHEGQLANFFGAVRNTIKGDFLLDGCAIERQPKGATVSHGVAPQLTAECSGVWLTLKNRNAP